MFLSVRLFLARKFLVDLGASLWSQVKPVTTPCTMTKEPPFSLFCFPLENVNIYYSSDSSSPHNLSNLFAYNGLQLVGSHGPIVQFSATLWTMHPNLIPSYSSFLLLFSIPFITHLFIFHPLSFVLLCKSQTMSY